MSQNRDKRERSINFTREEVDLLVTLVEKHKHLLENKKSDAVTWRQKEECWRGIEASFNATSGSTHRTFKNLRTKYEGLKRDTRKKSAQIRAETYRTGGGTSTAPVLTPSESKIKNMILLSVEGMGSTFDSDSLPNTGVTLPEHEVPSNENNVTDAFDTLGNADLEEFIVLSSCEYEQNKENVEDTPVRPEKRNLSVDTENTADLGAASSGQHISKKDNVEETPVRPLKRFLFDTQNMADLGEACAETNTKWSNWKPTSLRSRKHPALCKPKTKRPFEKVADSRMEVTLRQKIILEEEYENKKLQWAFEEEERQHKREMWELEKKLLLKKKNE